MRGKVVTDMQIGDLIMTKRGNLALVVSSITFTFPIGFVDLVFCDTGFHRTGFPIQDIFKVIKK